MKYIFRNDLNKQSGKTNGAAAECEEALLNERNKDTKAGKGIPNEELADGNSNFIYYLFNDVIHIFKMFTK